MCRMTRKIWRYLATLPEMVLPTSSNVMCLRPTKRLVIFEFIFFFKSAYDLIRRITLWLTERLTSEILFVLVVFFSSKQNQVVNICWWNNGTRVSIVEFVWCFLDREFPCEICLCFALKKIPVHYLTSGHSSDAVVTALCCKSLGCGFESRWCLCLQDVFSLVIDAPHMRIICITSTEIKELDSTS